jgi:NAD+ synthase (glutamine-hydrolysing)
MCRVSLKILIAQVNLLVGDVPGNARKIIDIANRARDAYAADAVLFPELTLTGYPPEDLLLRGELLQRVGAALEALCHQVRGLTVIVGYPRHLKGQLFNVAGVIQNGEIVAEYRKQALPNYGVFDEKRYFESGDAPCVVTLKGVTLGLSICEDIWVSAPVRQAKAAGAEVLINLNASPFHTGKMSEREDLVRERVRDNGLPVLYANLLGGQDELVFDGASFAMDEQGRVTHRCRFCEEDDILVELRRQDDGGLAVLPGRVERIPSDEAAIYQALVLGVRDYAVKNGFKGAVLGLSGGIDSALTLAIAVDALGAEQVEVVLMPSRYTADMSNEDAAAQARAMGVAYRTISIEPAFHAFLDMLQEEFAGKAVDVTEENIQARCRGIILMAISNKKGRILLTTGNKSEMSVGYATLYGDMAGGFAPIKDVPKLLVYALARYRNEVCAVIPERVLLRPPSAELRPDQRDEDSLPPYEVLDAVLRRYIEQDFSVREIIAEGFDPQVVRRITRLVDRNEYKRRQAPPGVRITRRAFGRDRRYPLTSGF